MMKNSTDSVIDAGKFAISQSRSIGLEGSNVNISLNKVFSTRFANSAIHQNFTDDEVKLEFTAISGQRKALININSFNENEITWAVQKAAKILKYLPNDPDFPGLLTEDQAYPKLQFNDPSIQNLTPSDIADIIVGGMNSSHEVSPDVKTVSGNINLKDGFNHFLSSEGLEYITPVTTIISTVNVMSDNGSNESRSNSSFGARVLTDLQFEKEAVDVTERSLLGLDAVAIDAKAYPVILDYQAVADQMFWIGISLSARYILEYLSFMVDKLGKQLFSDSLTLINDPHDSSSLGAYIADNDGVVSQKTAFIDQGVVKEFAHNRLTANKMGTRSNGCGFVLWGDSIPFPRATKVNPGHKSREKLIEDMDDGLLLTNLHYTNFIDPTRGTITGMTKDGVFQVKNGEIIGAVKNMRFTDNITNILSNIEPSTEHRQIVHWVGFSFDVPAIKTDSLTFSSQTSH
ncbi:MAG: TldD/PmbA family protein [Candidatus Hodarchaeota archaeon]